MNAVDALAEAAARCVREHKMKEESVVIAFITDEEGNRWTATVQRAHQTQQQP